MEVASQVESRRPVDPPVPSITSLVCPTRGRVRLLERALTSHAEAFARNRRDLEIVVSDDAESRSTCDTARDMLSALSRRYGVRIAYVGREARSRLAIELARISGVSPEIVRFAVLGLPGARVATGANRNTLLLLTPGEAVVSVDDDTLGRAAAAPEADSGVQVLSEDRFSSSHPADVWTFPSLDSALAALGAPVVDPIQAHERFLGRSVGGGGVVRVTLNGLVGEPTWPSAMGYLLLTGPSLDRMTSSRAAYRAAQAGYCVVKAVRRVTIVDRCHHAPAAFLGLDNRELLPPFLPVGRGQDIVWWETLARAFEGAAIAHLPFVMVHAPPRRRRLALLKILRSVSHLPLNRVIAALMREPEPRSEAALRHLGARLGGVGRADARTFAQHTRELIRRDLAALFDHLERRLGEESGADRRIWRREVSRFLWIARRTLARKNVFLPWDLADTGVTGGRQKNLQNLVCAFGQLLEAWPQIVQASRELRARGSGDLKLFVPRL